MSAHERLLRYTTFLLTVSSQLIMPILPVYIYEVLGASEQEVGAIISLAAVASAFTRTPSSILVMRKNALRILVFGIGLNTAALLGYALSTNPWMLGFFRILHGSSFALNYTLMLSLASLIVRPDRARRSITNYTASLALGLWVGPAVGVLLSSFLDLRMLMFAAAGISSATVFLGWAFTRSKPELWEEVYYSKIGFSAVRSLLKKPLLLPTALYFLYSMTIGGVMAYAPLKAKFSFGIGNQLVIFIFTGYFFLTYITRTILSRSISRIDHIKFLRFSMATCAVGVLTAGLAPNPWLFIAGIYLIAVAHGLTFPLTATITAHVIPPSFRILGNSIYLTSWDIGNLVGPLIIASILYFAPLSTALAATAVFAALALLLTGKIARIIA